MNKSYIILTVLLVLAIAGAGVVYQFYVKVRLAELNQAEQEVRILEQKITEMQETFYGTKPEALLLAYRESTEPWRSAARARHDYFQLPDRDYDVTVPEEQKQLARFWYVDEIRERMTELQGEARAARVQIPPAKVLYSVFDARDPDELGSGTNADADEVAGWLWRFERGAELIRSMIEAGATSIIDINRWPPRDGERLQSGYIRYITTGLHFQMPFDRLVEFLDDLRMEARYLSVDAIRITKRNLLEPSLPVNVEMLLTEARFMPAEGPGEVEAEETVSGPRASSGQAMIQQLLSGMATEEPEEESAKGDFLDRIVRWFPF